MREHHPSRRPAGQPTRGKTALNRLRQVDVYVALALPDLLRGEAPLAVDVGYGARPWTALEMAERWRRVNPGLRVLGVEIDPERVTAAAPFADPPRVDFALGGFNLSGVLGARRARIVRCYNVLRQYDEAQVAEALAAMAPAVEDGGALIEGTSNPSGAMVAFDVYRKRGDRLEHDALVFGTNFRSDLTPADFRTILPKRLIHRMLDERPGRFFEDWTRAHLMAVGQGLHGKGRWIHAAEMLRTRFDQPIDPRMRLIERGYLTVRDELR